MAYLMVAMDEACKRLIPPLLCLAWIGMSVDLARSKDSSCKRLQMDVKVFQC